MKLALALLALAVVATAQIAELNPNFKAVQFKVDTPQSVLDDLASRLKQVCA